MIRHNRSIIQQMDREATVDIETPHLKTLCDIAEAHGGAAKTSGAGGGDCGITIIRSDVNKNAIFDEWPLQFFNNTQYYSFTPYYVIFDYIVRTYHNYKIAQKNKD